MARDATWTNSDGLVVGFGTHTVDDDVQAVIAGTGGNTQVVVVEIDLTTIPDTFAAANRKPQDVVIPRGSVIKSAVLHTLVAPVSGGGGTLDIGTWGVTDVVDVADGIVADATVAEMGAVGAAILLDGAMIVDGPTASAAVGATSNSDCVIAPSYATAVFTAGRVRLYVEYIPPAQSSGRTIAA